MGEVRGECSVLAARRLEKALSGKSGPYAASFVTKARAAFLGADPTIFISCQS